ncbi:MAG: DUF11 domain-containing protein [Flavobacteriales bacterium]|nr:DUF11 domain-containing protein [Flavobacteriales bacterium]
MIPTHDPRPQAIPLFIRPLVVHVRSTGRQYFRSIRFLLLLPLLSPISESRGMDASIQMESPSFCDAPTGRLSVMVFGGVEPYTYQWSTGGTGFMISGLWAGWYSVTVTDATLTEITVEGEVESRTYSEWYSNTIGPPQVQGWCAEGTPYAYPYSSFTDEQGNYWVGPGPWTFFVNGEFTPTVPNPCYNSWLDPERYLPLDHTVGETVTVSYSDANGCPGEATITIKPPIPEVPLQVMSVSGSCSGLALGSVVVATGPWVEPPFPGAYYLGVAIRHAGGSFLQSECSLDGVQSAPMNGSVRTFTGLPPGDYEVVIRPSDNTMQAQPEFSSCQFVPFTVPDLGVDCGLVTGRAFMDYNLNCTRQTNEPYVPGGIIEVQPGPYYATTSSQGQYSVALPSGSYTAEQHSELLGEHCTGGPIPFIISPGGTSTLNFPDTSMVPLDVGIMLNSGLARPGFEFTYAIGVKNNTPAASGAITVTLESDPTITFLSATPNPSNVVGNIITWNQTQLTAWQGRGITVRFQVPPDVGLLGYELVATANVSSANTDGIPENDTATNYRTITGAYDPNDKLARTNSGGTAYWVLEQDEWIDYTIRFQNTGTDTAFNVVITDTLPPNLDPGTIIVGAASHNFTWELRDAGTLKFYFPNILLPDSNINEPRSHGFVGFRIRPRLPLLPGDEIENIANIYFDFNPPVITEPSVLTVVVPPLLVDVHAFLGGPYDAGSMSMTDALRTAGLLPLQEPYTALGYPHTGLGGDESTASALLAQGGAEAIVDWVLLELRDADDPAVVLASRSALICRDGRVVEVDGSIGVQFHVEEGPYHAAIRHRNHLGCMTVAPVALSQTIATVDFTSPSTATWGTEARKQVDGTLVLWPGDANFNGEVKYTGAANDRDRVLVEVGGNVPSNVVPGYGGADINLDGDFKYVGESNDRDIVLQTIGGVVPTTVKVEQVP